VHGRSAVYSLAHAAGGEARRQVGGFAQRLAGNGAGLQADTPDIGFALDEADAFAQAGRL